MNNTFPTEGNLSGLSRKDFQKDKNDKKTDFKNVLHLRSRSKNRFALPKAGNNPNRTG